MNHSKQRGFTLIEMMLSMTFISILLLMIAMTTIQISNIYNKGITLREVNQAGRAISDELQRSIAATTPFDVTPKTSAAPATANSHYVKFTDGGRLCLGQYSYVWNYGESIAKSTTYNKYTDNTDVRFAKVKDQGGALCSNVNLGARIVRGNATEMLVSGDRDLAIHKFDVIPGDSDLATGQKMYAIQMIIGTNDQAQLTSNDTSCQPPSAMVGQETYCSVNQFDIIAHAGNAIGSN
jgi:prepilin-type N-terminal cleavage/methylation domain-containing protein